MENFKNPTLVISLGFGLILLTFVLVTPFRNAVSHTALQVAVATGLTESQIQAILNVLISFGVDTATIEEVDGILHGETGAATTTGQ